MSRALQQARLALHSVAAYSHRPMESGDSEDEALEMERMWRELRDDARKKVFRQHLTMRIDLAARECAEQRKVHLASAEDLLMTAHGMGLFELVAWNRLATEYKRHGMLTQVLHILRRVQALGEPGCPDVITFNIAIDALGKAQQFHLAAECFREMQAAEVKPTINTFTSLIDAAGKVCDIPAALGLLQLAMDSHVHPNVCTFTSLITACMNTTDFDAGLVVLRHMHSYVHGPSREDPSEYFVPYNAFLIRAGRAGDVDKMSEVLDEMIKIARLSPPVSTFVFAVESCNVAGRHDLAWLAFEQMLLVWGPETADTAPSLLDAMAHTALRSDRVVHALGYMQRLVALGLVPTEALILELLTAGARLNLIDPKLPPYALRLLEQLLGRGELPDALTLDLLVDTAARCHGLEPALALLERMQQHGLAPSIDSITRVLELLYPALDRQRVPLSRPAWAAGDPHSHVAMGVVPAAIRARPERHALACIVFGHIVKAQRSPTERTFAALIRVCGGTGLLGFLSAQQYDLTLSDMTSTLLDACAATLATRCAADIAACLASRHLAPSMRSAHAVLDACIVAGDLQAFQQVRAHFVECGLPLEEILSAGFTPIPSAARSRLPAPPSISAPSVVSMLSMSEPSTRSMSVAASAATPLLPGPLPMAIPRLQGRMPFDKLTHPPGLLPLLVPSPQSPRYLPSMPAMPPRLLPPPGHLLTAQPQPPLPPGPPRPVSPGLPPPGRFPTELLAPQPSDSPHWAGYHRRNTSSGVSTVATAAMALKHTTAATAANLALAECAAAAEMVADLTTPRRTAATAPNASDVTEGSAAAVASGGTAASGAKAPQPSATDASPASLSSISSPDSTMSPMTATPMPPIASEGSCSPSPLPGWALISIHTMELALAFAPAPAIVAAPTAAVAHTVAALAVTSSAGEGDKAELAPSVLALFQSAATLSPPPTYSPLGPSPRGPPPSLMLASAGVMLHVPHASTPAPTMHEAETDVDGTEC